ncbi:hypothetical protein IM25_23985 (plasmid) [Rhodococcus sp. p52]|uniref:hypothetical protein n=2 Tax=Bacteria TaxID=2 RepID=UPI00051A1242|nr:hypothetical protein [Rhodococcus sp. p52]AOD24811.1 hypothetical protein IM25_23985 [Rhodococcus sp. p52]
MADTARTRRFRRTRPRPDNDPAVSTDARADANTAPQQPRPRPAVMQARQDVVDVAAFIGKVQTERSHGRPAPQPQPMKAVLGAFQGSPATQTTVQILAAAATARHFHGQNSAVARKWEQLAQDNAVRLEAMRAAQHQQQQIRYVQEQVSPQEMDRQLRARIDTERETDQRAFDAAGALALSYVAAQALPSFAKLTELSHTHLTAPEPTPVPDDASTTTQEHDPETTNNTATELHSEIDLAKSPDSTPPQNPRNDPVDTPAVEDADLSDRLEHVHTEPATSSEASSGADLEQIGSVLEKAGRGVVTAIGPVNGDDDVAPPLSPVDMNQLSQELLDGIAAAMISHPRSVTEMLNIERQPDHTNEAAFVPGTGVEHSHALTL